MKDGDTKLALFFREASKEVSFLYHNTFDSEIHDMGYKLGYIEALEDIQYSMNELYKKVRDRKMYNG